MTKYEVAQRLRDARLAAGLSRSEVAKTINRTAKAARWRAVIYSVSVTGILIGFFLYDVLNPAVGWLRRHKNSARLQPCGTKGKEREMRNLLPPIIS